MEESPSIHPSLETSERNEVRSDGNETKNDENETKKDRNETVNNMIEFVNRVDGDGKVVDPKIGMLFDTVDEVREYFYKYAKQSGFPVKKRSSKRGDDGELKYVTFSCSRTNSIKPDTSRKQDCKARLSVCICSDGRWRVSLIKLDHNHEVIPDKVWCSQCNQVTNSHIKRKIEVDQNISNLKTNSTDYNKKVRQMFLGEGDATSILNYLMKMQSQNVNFYYSIDLDKEGRLRNVFWADTRSREAYKEFGDVIAFDTTYLTSKYTVPFAPFLGVNHHGQSILFGCGLVLSEDSDTFTWLFKSWLACMSGQAPSGIITDWNEAIEDAIKSVFPNAKHNWCLKHIMKKLPKKLKDLDKSVKLALESIVYESFDYTEFELRWNEMIDKYKLQGNAWLVELYNARHHWVPSFAKKRFWAGMAGISPVQRGDNMNGYFDDYVKPTSTLNQFLEQYENALRSNVEKENQEDFKCISSNAHCVTHYDLEKHAQDVYTISKFKEFQSELADKMYCELDSVKVDGSVSEYKISEDIIIGETKKNVSFEVLFNEYDNEVKCSCGMYEFRGILCKHSIYVLIRHKINFIPEKYIMRRWRKDVKRCHTWVKIRYNDWDATPEAQRFKEMQKTFNEIKELAFESEDKSKIVMSWMQKLREELHNHHEGSNHPDSRLTY